MEGRRASVTHTPGMTAELIAKVTEQGLGWLTQLAEQGGLVGELRPLRRVAWLRLLGCVAGDSLESWVEGLSVQRQKYVTLVEDYKRETSVKALDPNVCNPLSRNSENPFVKLQMHEELMKEIWKDIERTFAEVDFLASPESRKLLQRVLFHWCRTNIPSKDASQSYRQGMNEIVAVSLSIVKQGEYAASAWESSEALGHQLCGGTHNEADTFIIFGQIMDLGLKPMFTTNSPGARPGRSPIGELPRSRLAVGEAGPPTSAILARCGFIFDQALKTCDDQLHGHLKRLEIEPQVFLLRWLRLLFCREFELEEIYLLWDGMFADARQSPPEGFMRYHRLPSSAPGAAVIQEAAEAAARLPLVDWVAVALLQAHRGELLRMDQTDCLRRLMSGAPPQSATAARTLAAAKRFRERGPDGSGTGLVRREMPTAQGTSSPSRSPHSVATPTSAASEPGAAPVEDPLRRGQALLNAAAQGVQGLLGGARQAFAPGARQIPAESSIEVAELQRRVAEAERERDTIKKKANEFYAAKKNEWREQINERDLRIAELEKQLQQALEGQRRADSLEAELAQVKARLRELEEGARPLGATTASSSVGPDLQAEPAMIPPAPITRPLPSAPPPEVATVEPPLVVVTAPHMNGVLVAETASLEEAESEAAPPIPDAGHSPEDAREDVKENAEA